MEDGRTIKIHCNRCGTETFHRVLAEKPLWGWHDENQERSGDFIDHPDEADWREDYELLQCCGCDDICMRHTTSDVHMPEDMSPVICFYPPRSFRRRPKWFSSLPSDIAAILDEVYSALAADSRRLAVMGVPATIDMVLYAKVRKQGTF